MPRKKPTQSLIRNTPFCNYYPPPGDDNGTRRFTVLQAFPRGATQLSPCVSFTRKKWLRGNALRPEPLQPGHPVDVVISRENHQHEHKGQTEAESHLLCPLGQRPPAQRLERIEQKMTAIEQGDRKQIQQTDRDREHRRQLEAGQESQSRYLPGEL